MGSTATVTTSTAVAPRPAAAFYRRVLEALNAAEVRFLVGGAYAFAVYAGIERHTKDLDLFLRRADYERASAVLAAAGCRTELTHPHWLGKAHDGALSVDLIFNSGNGLSEVDEAWFDHAMDAELLGVRVKIVPPEELLWTKMFIMERERYDGADVAHLLRTCADRLDWPRLMQRVDRHWRVLLSHLVLYGFIYPAERGRVPAAVMDRLLDRLRDELRCPSTGSGLCQGTLLSREQYLHDVERQGYADGRLAPFGMMSAGEVAAWTDKIPHRHDAAPPAA